MFRRRNARRTVLRLPAFADDSVRATYRTLFEARESGVGVTLGSNWPERRELNPDG